MVGNLAQVPLFRDLPASQLKHLAEHCELRRFRKGDVLFKEGQPVESVWLIQRGWVYLVKRTPQGTTVTICPVTPEEVICGFSAVGGEGTHYASAVAATETTAIRVPHTDLADLLKCEPGFAEQVLAIYHSRMRHMAETISLAPAPVERRLAYTIASAQEFLREDHPRDASGAGPHGRHAVGDVDPDPVELQTQALAGDLKRQDNRPTPRPAESAAPALDERRHGTIFRWQGVVKKRKDDLHHGREGAKSLT